FPDYPLAGLVPYLHGHAQARALQFATPDRQQWVAEGEAGDDIGTAGDGGQAQIAFDVAIDIVEALRGQRRAGGENAAQTAQAVAACRLYAGLFQGSEIPGADTEDIDALGVDQVDQPGFMRMKRRAIVE